MCSGGGDDKWLTRFNDTIRFSYTIRFEKKKRKKKEENKQTKLLPMKCELRHGKSDDQRKVQSRHSMCVCGGKRCARFKVQDFTLIHLTFSFYSVTRVPNRFFISQIYYHYYFHFGNVSIGFHMNLLLKQLVEIFARFAHTFSLSCFVLSLIHLSPMSLLVLFILFISFFRFLV